MDDFLSSLKKPVKYNTAGANTQKKEIFFLLDFDERGAFVAIVDKQLNNIETDYHLYNGDIFHVLRSIDKIMQEQQLQFSWDQTNSQI